jgi:hypothetical protein
MTVRTEAPRKSNFLTLDRSFRDEGVLNPVPSCRVQDDLVLVLHALLEDLTIQRTAAQRAEVAARPDIALIAVTHNLAAQVFEPMYGLASSLTVRTDAYSDRVDLRLASESRAAEVLAVAAREHKSQSSFIFFL